MCVVCPIPVAPVVPSTSEGNFRMPSTSAGCSSVRAALRAHRRPIQILLFWPEDLNHSSVHTEGTDSSH
jgi:hypothetical protein